MTNLAKKNIAIENAAAESIDSISSNVIKDNDEDNASIMFPLIATATPNDCD